MCIAVKADILRRIRSGDMQRQLDELQASADMDVFAKWYHVLRLLAPLTAEVVHAVAGLPQTAAAVQLFNVQCAPLLSQPGPQRAHRALWDHIMSVVFGLQAEPLPGDLTAAAAAEVAERLLQDDVALGVQVLCDEDEFGADLSDQQADVRRERVTEYIVSMQQTVLQKYNLDGDDGWLMFQRGLVDLGGRPDCTVALRSATARLYQLAQLVPRAA